MKKLLEKNKDTYGIDNKGSVYHYTTYSVVVVIGS